MWAEFRARCARRGTFYHNPTENGSGKGDRLVAPMPGAVIDLRAAVGDRVEAGQVLVVLEAMKMEHHIAAPFDGTVTEVPIVEGQQLDNGALLVVIEPAGDEAGSAADEGA